MEIALSQGKRHSMHGTGVREQAVRMRVRNPQFGIVTPSAGDVPAVGGRKFVSQAELRGIVSQGSAACIRNPQVHKLPKLRFHETSLHLARLLCVLPNHPFQRFGEQEFRCKRFNGAISYGIDEVRGAARERK